MVENLVSEIMRRIRRKSVAIIISSEIMDKKLLNMLSILRMKINKLIGEVRFAEVIYEKSIPESHYKILLESGFTHKIASTNLELSFLLEVYDIVLSEKVDFIFLGTTSTNLIPLYMEIKKMANTYAIIPMMDIPMAFKNSFDEIIYIDRIDNIENIIRKQYIDIPNEEIIISVDSANIGSTSSKLKIEGL